MTASIAKQFSKRLACPSSLLLVAFRLEELAPDIQSEVENHLAGCDFCNCELPLLAAYEAPPSGECRAPELPMNLRILAESILGHRGAAKLQTNVVAASIIR
jgi:hypothetical protein